MNKLAKGLLAAAAALTLVATAATPAQASPAPAPPKRPVYAALGDSFAFGVGTPNPPALAYPFVLARKLDKGTPTVTFLAAPIGVDTQSVAVNQVLSIPTDAKVITLTVGGNDRAAFEKVGACLAATLANPAAADALCATALTPPDLATQRAQVTAITGLLTAIKAKAPGAKVFVTGYPMLFEPNATRRGLSCTITGVPQLPPATISLLATVDNATRALNARIWLAAKNARAEYVGVTDEFAGHGLCDGTRSWINGPGTLTPLHPTVAGQQAYAKAIAADGFYSAAKKR